MGALKKWFARGGGKATSSDTSRKRDTVQHFSDFVASRVGVEAYIEPPAAETPLTVILIATTGEWTRRPVPNEKTAQDIANGLGIPCYNVRFTGYPQRMRDWNSRQRNQ